MTAVRRLISIACLAMAAATLLAQQTQTTTQTTTEQATTSRATEPVTADTDKDVTNPHALRLSLDDAVRTSIKQNLGIELQRYDYSESGQRLLSQWGVFDPLATAQLNTSHVDNATTSSLQSSSGGQTNADINWSQLLPTGGDYSIGFTNQRFTRGGGFGTTLTPGYATGLNFGLTQPLARNFGVDITKRNINIARNTLGINRELFRTSLMETSNSVEQAYLDLVYARQFVDVVKESLFLARDKALHFVGHGEDRVVVELFVLESHAQDIPFPLCVDVAIGGFHDAKLRAFARHRSQTQEWEPLRKFVEGQGDSEVFSLVGAAHDLAEDDLFHGVEAGP